MTKAELAKIWRDKNPEKVKLHSHKYYMANKEKIKAQRKAHWTKNRNECLERKREYYYRKRNEGLMDVHLSFQCA